MTMWYRSTAFSSALMSRLDEFQSLYTPEPGGSPTDERGFPRGLVAYDVERRGCRIDKPPLIMRRTTETQTIRTLRGELLSYDRYRDGYHKEWPEETSVAGAGGGQR